MSMKTNTLPGITDHAQAVANKEISDYTAMLKSKGGQFVGELKTYETDLVRSVDRTTIKTQEILKDPNIDPKNLPSNYRAAIVERPQTIEMADQTRQEFSGEWTQTQKAYLLSRKSLLLNAVIAALKEVNDTEAAEANLDVDAMLNYMFFGKKD